MRGNVSRIDFFFFSQKPIQIELGGVELACIEVQNRIVTTKVNKTMTHAIR